VKRHLGYFQFLAVVDIHVHVLACVSILDSRGYIHRGGLTGSHGNSVFNKKLLVFLLCFTRSFTIMKDWYDMTEEWSHY
jgi:hypothetical protein